MPTPSDNTPQLSTTSIAGDLSARATCPPEVDRWSVWRSSPEAEASFGGEPDALDRNAPSPSPANATTTMAHAHSILTRSTDDEASAQATSPGAADPMTVDSEGSPPSANASSKQRHGRESNSNSSNAVGRLSPAGEPSRSSRQPSSVTTTSSSTAALLGYEFSNVRLLPNYTSSFLRPGSKFTGTQQSDRQVYNVDVEIKHVDMAESYLCGYLRIQGLTEDHPTLTTFFEGEIIGTKHTFKTRHESWGATEKTDMNHWARFPAWRPLARQAKKPDFTYRDFAQRDHIFMRWKEYFLVPDHRVRTISGASFEGFYYICFNQVEGTVTGIYFHAKSEKYQQLELKHVEDHGCTPALEFR